MILILFQMTSHHSSVRSLMNRQCRICSNHRQQSGSYFILVLTNFPPLLERTRLWQEDPTMSNNNDPSSSDNSVHERILQNEFVYELRDSVRAYLQRTEQTYPIHRVFDFSDVNRA